MDLNKLHISDLKALIARLRALKGKGDLYLAQYSQTNTGHSQDSEIGIPYNLIDDSLDLIIVLAQSEIREREL